MHSRTAGIIGFFFLTLTLSANQLIVNGGFETGDFTGWSTVSSAGSGGGWFVCPNVVSCSDPDTSPDGNPTVGPNAGSYYAVSASLSGPGTNVLYQGFTDPIGTTSAVLAFSVFVNDIFGSSGVGTVDLLAGNANLLTGNAIATFYSADTPVTNGEPNPYVPYSGDISSLITPGNSYYLRFYESDSDGPVNVGVDSVSLVTSTTAAAPEPRMVFPLLLIAGFFAKKFYGRSREINEII